MKIYSVYDAEFKPYGEVVTGYDTAELARALARVPAGVGTAYVASEPSLEALGFKKQLSDNFYGGMPVQLGYCSGANTMLNCLEYHRDSEVNFGTQAFILLLARQEEIENGLLNSGVVKAFLCPEGVMVNIYATTLHYAPCSAKKGEGFRVLVALPKGTNEEKPAINALNPEDKMLWARNKWLYAHKNSTEAKEGAYVGLVGENIDIEQFI